MTPYRIYKHVNCLDVAIIPLKVFYVKEKKLWKVRVKWIIYKDDKFVRGLNISERIVIRQEDMKNWKFYGAPDFFVNSN